VARRGAVGTTSHGAVFYHVTTDNRFPYWVYGAQSGKRFRGDAERSDYGEITFRDWHLIGIFEYGYIAIDPLDPNILYGDWLTAHEAGYRRIREGYAGADSPRRISLYAGTLPVVFSPLEPHHFIRGQRPFQDDGCGKQLAGHQSRS